METFGEFLQQMRQQRGVTLEHVVSRTKISLRMLKALEQNDFSQIPGEVIARGFVRAYARFLGLDETEVIKRYRESVPPFYAKIPEAEAPQNFPAQIPGKRWRATKLMVGIVMVLMGITLYARLSPPPQLPVQEAVFAPAAAPSDENIIEVVQPSPEQSATFPVGLTVNVPGLSNPPVQDSEAGSPSNGESLTLVVEALERSWVMAHIDDRVIKEVILQPGEKIRWQAKTKFVLNLGNAGGVKLELNGKALDPLGPSGKVVKHVTFTR